MHEQLWISVSFVKTFHVISNLHLKKRLFVPVFGFMTVKGENDA